MKEATSSASGLGAKTFVPHIRYNNFYSHKMYFSMKTYFFSSFGYTFNRGRLWKSTDIIVIIILAILVVLVILHESTNQLSLWVGKNHFSISTLYKKKLTLAEFLGE